LTTEASINIICSLDNARTKVALLLLLDDGDGHVTASPTTRSDIPTTYTRDPQECFASCPPAPPHTSHLIDVETGADRLLVIFVSFSSCRIRLDQSQCPSLEDLSEMIPHQIRLPPPTLLWTATTERERREAVARSSRSPDLEAATDASDIIRVRF